MPAPTLVYDKTQAPLLKITVTSDNRAFAGGRFDLTFLGGSTAGIDYSGGVLPFYGYTDSVGRVWTKISDDGVTAVFTSQA